MSIPSTRQKSSFAGRREVLYLHNTPKCMFDGNYKRDPNTLRERNKYVQQHRQEQRMLQVVVSSAPLGWQQKPSSGRSTALGKDAKEVAESSTSATQTTAVTITNSHLGFISATSSRNPSQGLKSPGLPHAPEPGRASLDDFCVFLEPLDTERYRIVQHFIHGFLPLSSSFYRKAMSARSAGSWEETTVDLVRGCFSSKLHFSVLMTTACASMKYHFGYHFQRPETLSRYMDISVRLLRQYLSEDSPVTEQLIMTIFCIGASEGWLGNPHGAWIHYQAISRLSNTYLGGFRYLNPALRGMIMFPARLMAAAVGKPAVCEDVGEGQPCNEEQRLLESLTNLCNTTLVTGSGFNSGSEDLGFALHQCLTEIFPVSRELQFRLYGYKTILPEHHAVIGQFRRLRDRLLFLPHHVIAGMSARQDCVRLAVAIWLGYSEVINSVPSEARENEAKITISIILQSLRSRFATFLLESQSQLQADYTVHQKSNSQPSEYVLESAGHHGRLREGGVAAMQKITAPAICRRENQLRCAQAPDMILCNIGRLRPDKGVNDGSDCKFSDQTSRADSSLQQERLCMWIAAIGFLASETEQDRAWFENHFKHLACTLGIHSWTEVANLAQRYLWLDHIEQANQMRISKLSTMSLRTTQ